MKYTMQLQVMKTLQDTDNIQSHIASHIIYNHKASHNHAATDMKLFWVALISGESKFPSPCS